MSFYSEFATAYERVFPVREVAVRAVCGLLGADTVRVLDVGCGPGHLCGRLAAAGHRCTGLDLDEAMIARARELYPDVDARVLDMRRVGDLDGTWDTALCLGNVLPHLDAVDVSGFLGTLHHRLEPGAPWVVQAVDRGGLPGDAYDFPVIDAGDGHVFERRYEGLTGSAVRFLTRLSRDGVVLFEGETTLHLMPVDELVERHAAAGFSLESLHADFAGTPREPGTTRGIAAVFRRDLT